MPATRLEELAAVVAATHPAKAVTLGDVRWGRRLTVVLGADLAADVERVKSYDAAHDASHDHWWGKVEAVELRASTADAIDARHGRRPRGIRALRGDSNHGRHRAAAFARSARPARSRKFEPAARPPTRFPRAPISRAFLRRAFAERVSIQGDRRTASSAAWRLSAHLRPRTARTGRMYGFPERLSRERHSSRAG